MPEARLGRDARCGDVPVAQSVVTEGFVLLSLLLPHSKTGVNLGRVGR